MKQQLVTKNVTSKGLTDLNKKAREEKREQGKQIATLKANDFETNIASAGLSETEEKDIIALNKRRNKSKDSLKFFKKRSGTDTVALKRLEEAEAAAKLGLDNFALRGPEGRKKLFANPNHDLGLPSDATPEDREFMVKQQQEHRARLQKQEEHAKRQQQREKTGQQIRQNLNITKSNQKRQLKKHGINLNTSSLSNKTLAILRKRGLL